MMMMRAASSMQFRSFSPESRRRTNIISTVQRAAPALASCESDACPLPDLVVHADDAFAVFPLGPRAIEKIKTLAVVTQQGDDGTAVAWHVPSDQLVQRDFTWPQYLRDVVGSLCGPHGTPRSSAFELQNGTLAVLEPRGQVPVPCSRLAAESVFATLVVIFPSDYTGGHLKVQQDTEYDDGSTVTETLTWAPADRANRAALAFALFSNGCEVVAAPLVTGTAVCLVYQVVNTRPPRDVPLLQRSVGDCLEARLTFLANHLNIPPDAWRTIYGFLSWNPRHFAHLIRSSSFETLSDEERTVVESLSTFCAQSNGEYALYLAKTLCSRDVAEWQGPGDRISFIGDLHVTLKAPWLKHGASTMKACAAIPVDVDCVVMPLWWDQATELEVKYVCGMDKDDRKIIKKTHPSKPIRVGVGSTFALVVQSVCAEQRPLAKMPIQQATARIRRVLKDSRAKALHYGRLVVACRSPWILGLDPKQHRLNSHEEYCFVPVRVLVSHFGWDACIDAVVTSMLATPTLRSRLHLVRALIDATSGSRRINQLLEPLLAHHPWVDVSSTISRRSDRCTVEDFNFLLDIVEALSPAKMLQVLSVKDPQTFVDVVVSAIGVKARDQRSVEHVSRHFDTVMARVRTAPFFLRAQRAVATLKTLRRGPHRASPQPQGWLSRFKFW